MATIRCTGPACRRIARLPCAVAFRKLDEHEHFLWLDYAGTNLGTSFSLPANKATTQLDWQIAAFRTALTWYHTGGYDQKASTAASAVQSRVDSYEQFDAYLGWAGIENLTLYTKVENLFNEKPPYDASFPGIRAPYDFTQYDLRGRTFLVGLEYRL
ncbi:MAG TPA: hypothetical protein VGE08_01290 [Steroidobacter sp.]